MAFSEKLQNHSVSTHFFFSILNNAFLHVLMYFLKKNEYYLIKYQVNLHSEENKMCVKTFDCSLFFLKKNLMIYEFFRDEDGLSFKLSLEIDLFSTFEQGEQGDYDGQWAREKSKLEHVHILI